MSTASVPVAQSEIPVHRSPGDDGTEVTSAGLLADPIGYFLAGYRQYGPIFRTRRHGRDCVVIAGQSANEFFWQNPENWNIGAARAGFTSQLGPTHVTQLAGAPHARKRRLLKPGFSLEAVARHVPTLAAESARFLADTPAGPVDLMDLGVRLLLHLNSRTLLQAELSAAEAQACIRFEEDLLYGLQQAVRPEDGFGDLAYVGNKEAVFALLDRLVAERFAGVRRDDNLQALIDQDAGALGALTPTELRYDCYLLLIAAIENTGRLITRCLERLATNPEWIGRIRAELTGYQPDSFSRGLGACPSLKALIQETERLNPFPPFMVRNSGRDLEFGGYPIPAATTVIQVHTLLHFMAENFPDPLRFDPGRWLTSDPSRRTHVPFGGGVHVCLGLNVARLQVPVVLAELLRHYDVELGYAPRLTLALDPGYQRPVNHFPASLRRRA